MIGCELLRRYHAGELHLAGGDPAREGGAGESGGSRHRGHAVAGAVDHGDDVTVDLHAEHHQIGALAALLGELLHQRASGDQRLDRLDVARPAHGFLGHVLDAWHAHRGVGLGQQCAQAVSEEGLDIADARDLDDLEPRQRRDLEDLAVPDDARWPQVFVEQILGRPGDHVAIGLFRVGREAADLDVDLLGPACRQRPAGDEVGQARCQTAIRHDGHARRQRRPVQLRRILDVVRQVHVVALGLHRRLRRREAEAPRQRAHDEVVLVQGADQLERPRQVALHAADPGKVHRRDVGHGDVVIAGEVVSDDAALTAATQDDDACHGPL